MADLTREQIKARLRALDEYEPKIHRAYSWPGEDPDAVDRELDRIARSRTRLHAMLKELGPL